MGQAQGNRRFRPMLQITFHLRSPDAAMFDQIAKGCGGRSALVRWMVGELIAGRLAPPLLQDTTQISAIAHNLVEIELTDAQAAALDVACASRGMCRSQWIEALVSCRLGAPTAFSRGDRVSLRNTTRILKTLTSDVRRLQFESKLSRARTESGLEDVFIHLMQHAPDNFIHRP